MTVTLIIEALILGFGSTLGFFTRAAAELPFHEVSLLALALLETSGFTNPDGRRSVRCLITSTLETLPTYRHLTFS